jgi:hypothetical protein
MPVGCQLVMQPSLEEWQESLQQSPSNCLELYINYHAHIECHWNYLLVSIYAKTYCAN